MGIFRFSYGFTVHTPNESLTVKKTKLYENRTKFYATPPKFIFPTKCFWAIVYAPEQA